MTEGAGSGERREVCGMNVAEVKGSIIEHQRVFSLTLWLSSMASLIFNFRAWNIRVNASIGAKHQVHNFPRPNSVLLGERHVMTKAMRVTTL